MNNAPPHTFFSEDAVRSALHPRVDNPAMDAPDCRQSDGPVAAGDASRRAKRPRGLRRWSVAELVARAVAQPRPAAPVTEGR
jgi:hypothetical protein